MCKEAEQTTSSVAKVPDWIEKASSTLVDKAGGIAAKPYKGYKGQRVAELNQDQSTAFQAVRDLVANPQGGQAGIDAVAGAQTYAAAPASTVATERVVDEGGRLGKVADYLNPYLKEALAPALADIMEASQKQANRIGAMGTSAGAFGDARHGILEAELQTGTKEAIGDTSSRFLMDALNQAMGLRTNDLNRFGQVDQFNSNATENALQRGLTGSGAALDRSMAEQQRQLQAIQALLGAGNQQQATTQAGLDARYEDFLRRYGHQFTTLDALGQALGQARYTQEQTGTTTSPDNSGLQLLGSAFGAVAPAIVSAI